MSDTAKFDSGATSSVRKPPYDQVELSVLRRLAKRMEVGQRKHGRGNWKRAFTNGQADTEFLRDRYSHAVEHLFSMRTGESGEDDIGALLWFCQFAVVAEEEFGVNWKEILQTVTPEEESNSKTKGK